MSLAVIKDAMEVHLNGMSPNIAIAFEAVPYRPVSGTPYQRVTFLPAQPDNPSIGAELHREIGLMQVTLAYPANAGTHAALAQAEVLRERFRRGTSLLRSGITVIIPTTPTIGPASPPDGDRIFIPVSIRYEADVFA